MSITRNRLFPVSILFVCLLAAMPAFVAGQTDDAAALKKQARALIDAQNLNEALPLYERLAILLPNDAEVQLYLGFSLMGRIANTEEPELRKKLRIKARNAFIRAKELGDDSVAVKGYIDGIPADGSDGAGFSDNAEANKLMQKAEAAFSNGKMDDALASYQAALKLDPRCYHAALFSGDVFKSQQKYADAETWYMKAVAINPDIETAYRYSATALMASGKKEQARDRYVEAFITQPYNRLALSGIVQWGQATNTKLAHPKIDVPKLTVDADGKSNSTINIDPTAMDSSLAWMSYVTTRGDWKKEKFAKAYPGETQYRHSLQEEAAALRSVVKMAADLKSKTSNRQFEILSKLDKEGLLEAYILLAIPDQGISKDHPAYLKTDRDKLRRYVLNYVIQK